MNRRSGEGREFCGHCGYTDGDSKEGATIVGGQPKGGVTIMRQGRRSQ